jgi:hypothetical protein
MTKEPVHPVFLALSGQTAHKPSYRDGKGRWMPGASANPGGIPKGWQPGKLRRRHPDFRARARVLGIAAVDELTRLLDKPDLPFLDRLALLSEAIQLSYACRAIRSDASAAKRAERARQQAELERCMDALARRVEVDVKLHEKAILRIGPESETDWLR